MTDLRAFGTSWLHANGDRGTWPATWWAEGLDLPAPLPPLDGAAQADLCVVGGGITGLSAALHAARAGMSVILLEAQRVGWGASGRNGGQVGTGLNWDQPRLEAKLGPARARAVWDLTEAARRLTRELAGQAGTEWHPGILHACRSQTALDAATRTAARMARDYGTATETLDRADLQARIGTSAYAGGVLDPAAGWINPLAYTLGLARACLAAGVRIHEGAEVHRVGPPVATARGRVTARFVLHATNGYGTHLGTKAAARVLPINNYIAVTEPLARPPMADPVAVADDRFVVNYFRQTPDGRLLYGGGESYGRRFPADIAARVRANLARTYPELADVRFTHAWGGTLAVTATRLPWLAETAPGRFAAGGYSGHGLALAGLAGQLVVEAMRGERARFDKLAALPVPALPGGRLFGGLMAQAGMVFGALKDRLG
ncbi:NAD(P)/FAD-dependent oxidoreductase [Jannaschia ovalis]|uniref:FAD-dependent oxidoreductase n=1 Tax=Jannaschia ovalis TaxID=3038773 RepID=A0ABY8LEM7_9RHOB|nr:FAD-dependent oxidoreductase [Jannaschia sp. GRR-S6-38]WGH79747.1 FAD-dependent oxidoreductase [Jannaschia sp. GRR-S6-38]